MAQFGDLKKLFVGEGAFTVFLGAMALFLPPLIGAAAIILLGWLLMASGLVGLVATLRGRQGPGFMWALLSAVLTLVAGVMLYAWPWGGLTSLFIALALFLVLDGLLAIGFALEHRRHMTTRWIWLLGNGAADILIAAIIVAWRPALESTALSLFIGADMVISGATLLVMGIDMADTARATP